MKRLKNVEYVVEQILDANEETRASDDVLYLCVCEHFCNGISLMTLNDFLTTRREMGFPSFETVRRTRQKIFATRPELKPEKVTEERESMRDVYVNYALNG